MPVLGILSKKSPKNFSSTFWMNPRRAHGGNNPASTPHADLALPAARFAWFCSMAEVFEGPPKSGGDILGEAQWLWLTDTLENSTSQVHLICSGSQILPTEHRHEKWADYPDSRKRLLDLLARTKKTGVIFLSGDRHMAEISRLEHAGTSFTEVTSSGMTHFRHDFNNEKNSLRIGDFFADLNFGTIEIDWDLKKISLAIRTQAGSVVRNAEVRF